MGTARSGPIVSEDVELRLTCKPQRPYRNILDFRQRRSRRERLVGDWPCLDCEGTGRVVDPNYQPCYESRTEYVRCKACEGTGKGTEKACREKYRAEIARWREEVKTWEKQEALIKSGLAKLTPEEQRALGL
jgi:hypothetical protein